MAKDRADFIYLRLFNDLRQKIFSGELKPGEKLPPEYEMKDHYGVSRDSLRKALAKLEQNGYITRRAGMGTYVKFKKADYPLMRMESFSEQMRARGLEPSSEILSIELSTDMQPHVRDELALGKADRIYKICRIRKTGGQPMAYEIAYIPYKLCAGLHTHLLDDTSLYEVYEGVYQHRIGDARISLEAELSDHRLQKLLGLKASEPLLKMICTAFLEDGRPLYHVVCYYIGEKYIFTTSLPR